MSPSDHKKPANPDFVSSRIPIMSLQDCKLFTFGDIAIAFEIAAAVGKPSSCASWLKEVRLT
jgi:hypothetical protein